MPTKDRPPGDKPLRREHESARSSPWRKESRGKPSRGRPSFGWKPRPHRTASVDMNDGIVRIYGLHPVEAALANTDRKVNRVLATANASRKLATAITARGLTPEETTPRDLDKLLGSDAVHQGILVEADPLPEPELTALANDAKSRRLPIVVLDQVTDPHNVGAILRSAAVFGAAGVVMTRRHSPPLNGTLAKSASGALELVPIAVVQNLARALAELKEAGLRVLALDGDGDGLLDDEPFQDGIAVVLGAEGRGLRQSTRESADAVVRIATEAALSSLNVSNAAAITLHLAAMRRRGR